MKLSIITVNLNNRDGLQKTIDSVVAQTFKDFEWIVIDGGSTDGSKELIEQYADHFAYWVSEPDKGIYNAMNKGIKVAKGDYLQFLNSGDWLCDETVLERCLVSCSEADVLYGNLYLLDGVNVEPCVYPESLTLRFFVSGTLCHNATFIKRGLLQPVGYNEQLKLVSDWEFFLAQIMKNRVFVHINEFVVYYDMKGISTTNRELVDQEREKVIKQLVPESIIADYRHMDEMDAKLNQTRVKKVIEYSWKNRLYRKMITGCLSIIDWLDRRMG